MDAPGSDQTCTHGRDALAVELRALALLALDRLDPVLARLRSAASAERGRGASSVACPVCTALGAVRGERPDVAARLAEHTAGLIAALRDALAEAEPTAAPPPTNGRSTRVVQRIPVERASRAEEAPC